MKSATRTAALLDFGYLKRNFGGRYAARFCIHLHERTDVSEARNERTHYTILPEGTRTYLRDSGVSCGIEALFKSKGGRWNCRSLTRPFSPDEGILSRPPYDPYFSRYFFQ